MSRMEYNKGTLHPTGIDTEHFTDENYEDCEDNGLILINGEFYYVKWEAQGEEMSGFNNTVIDGDGVIHFETYHHNGCAHWIELVQERC